MKAQQFTRLFKTFHWIALILALTLIAYIWTKSGVESLNFDTDVARDLKQISNIQLGETVWLGPWLGPGLHSSSVYYYMLYPFVVLFGGKAVGIVYGNLCIGLVALCYFGYLSTKKYQYAGVIATVLLGTLPMVSENILHPGNGFTYLYFVIMCLSALWLEGPLWIASLAAGFAFALHPVAGFLPFLLFVKWWQHGRSWKAAILNVVVFALPSAPTIAFEVITRGYMTRNFLAKPSSNGILFSYSLENAQQIGNLVRMSLVQLITLLFFSWYVLKQKMTQDVRNMRALLVVSIVLLGGTVFLQNLIWRYLFGIALIIWFAALVPLLQKKIVLPVLLVLVVISLRQSPLLHPYPPAGRTIPEIESIADFIVSQELIQHDTPIALVAALSPGAEVPQADDYQFFLRNRGYTITETTDHDKAATLLYIIEVPGFDWERWSNWEIDSFGEKHLKKVVQYSDRVTLVVFEKK